ncbi:MAG: hypothetical protein AB1489_21545 [Acidobacteriota bacterium]
MIWKDIDSYIDTFAIWQVVLSYIQHSLALALWLPEFILRLFVTDPIMRTITSDWIVVANSWFATSLLIAFTFAIVMLLIKWLMKIFAIVEKHRIWTRRQTILFLAVGLLLNFISLTFLWYADDVFFTVVAVYGLLNGILSSWLIYAILVSLGHLVFWRRELF